MKVTCEQCGKEFEIPQSVVAIGKGRFCSRPCYDIWKTGKPRKQDDSLEERFWSHVDKSGGPDACWSWTGWTKDGYGRFDVGQKHIVFAHRMAWELENGSIPNGMCICHRLDNPSCCNPAHLFLGTHADNVADCIAKNRRKYLIGPGNHNSKLTADQVLTIRKLRIEGMSTPKLAKQFGVSVNAIHYICIRKNWKHI